MVLGVIGVALIAAIVTYLVLRMINPPKSRVVPPTTTAGAASSSTTTTLPTGPAITPAELSSLVAELTPFVERERRLDFTTRPTAILDDDTAYATALRSYLQRSRPLMDRLTKPFEVLGLNPNDADMDRAPEAFVGSKSVVFYDTVHNIIHVRATPATPYLSTMLVVGLTEQLDDQHFTTDEIANPSAYGDADFGMMTLVGGDAWRIAAAWANTRPTAEQAQITAELGARRGDDTDTSKVPSALSSWLRYPADHGVRFTLNLVTASSAAPLDAVFADPPDGSAQVLSPARIAAKIPQLPVAKPKVEGKVTSSGTFGRFFLESVLGPLVSEDTLTLAMNGYRGDTLVTYDRDDDASCVRMDITTGESSPENMRKAVTAWADERDGTVSLVADPSRSGRKLVRLDVCTGGGGNTGSTTTTTPAGASGTNPGSTVPSGPRP